MKPIFITDEGKKLIASAVGGGDPIRFTRISTLDPEKKTAQSTLISGVSRSGDLCEVFGILDNSEVLEGYYIHGLELFAQSAGEESGEILFGFCEENSDAFYMPAGSENSRTEVTLRIALTADCSESIILRPNSDAYASAIQVREEIARLDEVISRKITEHDLSSDVHNALLQKNNITAEKITGLGDRLDIIEIILKSDAMTNSAAVAFADLSGVEFNGIWNNTLKRIEF